jgi:bifunctional UDP-N-acetylglucosamine pyrophosphorylase/glucosamine-1-phosphate N-acetyltransferase
LPEAALSNSFSEFPQMATQSFTAIVLAAGKGTRMRSPAPKVLQPLAGRSMLFHVLKALKGAGASKVVAVVGYGRELVDSELTTIGEELYLPVESVFQAQQMGTGDAVKVAIASMTAHASEESVVIVNGDCLLLQSQTLEQFFADHTTLKSALCIGALELSDPTGYGRVVTKGKVAQRIVEEREATAREQKIQLVNGGAYITRVGVLRKLLPKIKASKRSGEFYLTDLVALANAAKLKVGVSTLPSEDLLGANDPFELATAENIWRERKLLELMQNGVRFVDPLRVTLDEGIAIGAGSVIEPDVMLLGATKVGQNVTIQMGSRIESSLIEDGALIKAHCYFLNASVGQGAHVGPFANLRPGTKLGANTKVGNFVEFKQAVLGDNSKVSHLSYVGDATIGKDVNIGCGFITCNYDGFQKHQTKIEDGAFIGSDVQVVAPLTVGRDSYIASGTTLTLNVPEGSLAVARVKQENKIGYSKRIKDRMRRAGK